MIDGAEPAAQRRPAEGARPLGHGELCLTTTVSAAAPRSCPRALYVKAQVEQAKFARKKGQALPKSNTRPKGIKGPRMALKETESNTETLHTPVPCSGMPFSLLERLSATNALSGALESANSVPDPLGGAAERSAAARAAEPAPYPLGHRDQHGNWAWRCPDCMSSCAMTVRKLKF